MITPRSLLIGCLLLAAPAAARAQSPTKAYAFVPHSSSEVSVIDATTRTFVASMPAPGVNLQAAASPDGRLVYVVQAVPSQIRVFDVATLLPRGTIVLGGNPTSVAFTPDARRAYVTSLADTVYVVDVATETVGPPVAMPPGSGPRRVVVSPDGRRALVLGQSGLYAIDTATDTVVDSLDLSPGGMQALALTPDGRSVLVVDDVFNALSMFDATNFDFQGAATLGVAPSNVAVAPHGQFAYVSSTADNTVSVIDLVSLTSIATVPVTAPLGAAFTADGRYAHVVSQAPWVTVIDAAILQEVASIPIGMFPTTQGSDFVTPMLLVPDAGPVSIWDDGVFSALGFGAFVPIHGGELSITQDVTTTRHVSILSSDGFVDTGDSTLTLLGDIVGDGILVKDGIGTLRLEGTSTHYGTEIDEGEVVVNGTHAGPMLVVEGFVTGQGTIEDLWVFDGTVAPGEGIGMLHASNVALSWGSTLLIQIAGTAAGTGYDRLDVSTGLCLDEPTLQLDIDPAFVPVAGTTFMIATNACGNFLDLPQGTEFTAGGRAFRIDYEGGDGNDVVLTALGSAPTITTGPPLRITESGEMQAVLTITDPDGDVTACSATSSDTGIVENGTGVGAEAGPSAGVWLVRAVPKIGAVGDLTITASCVDAVGHASNVVSIPLSVVPTTYYLAEGASGSFFRTNVAVLNPNPGLAYVLGSFWREGDSFENDVIYIMEPLSRLTLQPQFLAGFESAAFSTRVMSIGATPLAVDRTMTWGDGGYGAHAERATPGPAMQAWFAEGSQGYFSTFLLLNNPHPTANAARVTYFREEGAPVVRDYVLPARARTTIFIGADPELVDAAFGMHVAFSAPAIAERVMYFGTTPFWEGGHASAGSTSLSTSWFMAEGATGNYFSTFILVANPNSSPADVTLTYFPSTGVPVTRTVTIPAGQRLTRNIAMEDPSLANAAVATRVTSTLPVVAERSQYWGADHWIEGHNSAGVIASSLRWAFADGRVGGADAAQTYVLLANTGATAATVTATFVRDSGAAIVKTFTVPPTSRFNVAVSGPDSQVPELAGESFGAVLESTEPIVVERSVYSNATGVVWAAGTNSTATPLP